MPILNKLTISSEDLLGSIRKAKVARLKEPKEQITHPSHHSIEALFTLFFFPELTTSS
jgi:hypothetical protein